MNMKVEDTKKIKGITLIALMITVVILLILVGISVYEGSSMIKKAQLEEIKTNMLLIQAKSKEYVEEAIFKMGINPTDEKKNEVRQEVYVNEAGLEKAGSIPSQFGFSDTSLSYWLTLTAQENWGLSELELEEGEKYLIRFNEENETVEVYNTLGYDGLYSLEEINKVEI